MLTVTNIRRTAAVASCAAALCLAVSGPASAATSHQVTISRSSAAATGSCKEWFDSNTFGAECNGYPYQWIYAVATCNDGTIQYGNTEGAFTGIWSYAYCAGHGGRSNGYFVMFS